MIKEGEKGNGIYSQIVENVQHFKTLTWCLDMIKLKKDVIDGDFLKNILNLNRFAILEFSKVLTDMNYVTFK